MSDAIIPSIFHNDVFLNEPININKTQYIEHFISENEYYREFTNYDTNSFEILFKKSKFIVSKIYHILVEKILEENNEQIKQLVYLQKEQLNELTDILFNLNNPHFLYTTLFRYLETLKITQLIYLKQNLDFKIFTELTYNKISVSYDKIYNIDNIKDMNNPIYNYLYNNNIPINNRIVSSNLKTKKDYIKKYYLTNNYYSYKENIIDYIKYVFNKCYIELTDINQNYNKLKINTQLYFIMINILSQNNDWNYKFKWFLYYLNEEQLIALEK